MAENAMIQFTPLIIAHSGTVVAIYKTTRLPGLAADDFSCMFLRFSGLGLHGGFFDLDRQVALGVFFVFFL